MGEFRIGRTHAQHAYPEPPTGSALLLLARNFADSNQAQVVAEAGTDIIWNVIDVGADPSALVQITPKSTGKVIVKGVIVVENADAANAWSVTLEGLILTLPQPLPAADATTVPASGVVSVPFLMEYSLSPNVTVTIGIRATAQPGAGVNLSTTLDASSLSIQEVVEATG